MALEKLPIDPINGGGNSGGSTGGTTPPVTTSTTKSLSWYQDKRFLFGAFVFIVIVWLAATYLA